MAILIGIVIYLLIFSRYVIEINVKLILCIKKITRYLYRIISYPIIKIFKIIKVILDKIVFYPMKSILKRPINFIIINVNKKIKNICKIKKKIKEN